MRVTSQQTDRRVSLNTLDILQRGEYLGPHEQVVSIRDATEKAVEKTVLFDADSVTIKMDQTQTSNMIDKETSKKEISAAATVIEITQESVVECVQRLYSEESDSKTKAKMSLCAIINGSSRQPGGQFRTRHRTQEEKLVASSSLYPCLCKAQKMYQENQACRNSLFTHSISYTPDVPVFRGTENEMALLDQPFPISVITSTAVSAVRIRQREPEKEQLVPPTMRERIRRMLWVASQQGHTTLVIEAFGCGSSGHHPVHVAEYFYSCLNTPMFAHAFERIVFALDEEVFGESFQVFGRRFLLDQPTDPEENIITMHKDPYQEKHERKRRKKQHEKDLVRRRDAIKSAFSSRGE